MFLTCTQGEFIGQLAQESQNLRFGDFHPLGSTTRFSHIYQPCFRNGQFLVCLSWFPTKKEGWVIIFDSGILVKIYWRWFISVVRLLCCIFQTHSVSLPSNHQTTHPNPASYQQLQPILFLTDIWNQDSNLFNNSSSSSCCSFFYYCCYIAVWQVTRCPGHPFSCPSTKPLVWCDQIHSQPSTSERENREPNSWLQWKTTRVDEGKTKKNKTQPVLDWRLKSSSQPFNTFGLWTWQRFEFSPSIFFQFETTFVFDCLPI